MAPDDNKTPNEIDDPVYRTGMIELLGVLAYGEMTACERLAEDAGPALAGMEQAGGDPRAYCDRLVTSAMAHERASTRFFSTRRALLEELSQRAAGGQ